MEVLTLLMLLAWAVSIYFRFLAKETTHYHSSPVILNIKAENRGKRTKKCLNFAKFSGGACTQIPLIE